MTCTIGIFTIKGVLALFGYACLLGVILGIAKGIVDNIFNDRKKRREERR